MKSIRIHIGTMVLRSRGDLSNWVSARISRPLLIRYNNISSESRWIFLVALWWEHILTSGPSRPTLDSHHVQIENMFPSESHQENSPLLWWDLIITNQQGAADPGTNSIWQIPPATQHHSTNMNTNTLHINRRGPITSSRDWPLPLPQMQILS